jgi:hypothetical protein
MPSPITAQGSTLGPAPLRPNEVAVQQYGPEWMAHLARGGAVRVGAYLIVDTDAERADMLANGADASDLSDEDVAAAYVAGLV